MYIYIYIYMYICTLLVNQDYPAPHAEMKPILISPQLLRLLRGVWALADMHVTFGELLRCCSMLQYVAVCCSMLQCPQLCCSGISSCCCCRVCEHWQTRMRHFWRALELLQGVAGCCSVLQCVGVLQCVRGRGWRYAICRGAFPLCTDRQSEKRPKKDTLKHEKTLTKSPILTETHKKKPIYMEDDRQKRLPGCADWQSGKWPPKETRIHEKRPYKETYIHERRLQKSTPMMRRLAIWKVTLKRDPYAGENALRRDPYTWKTIAKKALPWCAD